MAFQIMVGTGSLLALISVVFLWLRWRRPQLLHAPLFLLATALATPLGFIAIEAGWTVTEVGRQPWIIYGVMRTADAVSPMPGLVWPLCSIIVVYGVLSAVCAFVLLRLIRTTERGEAAAEHSAPITHEAAAHG